MTKRAPLVGDPIIAANLKRALVDAGMSPAELARRLDLSAQAVSQWLNAQTTPRMNRLRQIANVLNVPIENLGLRPAPMPVVEAEFIKELRLALDQLEMIVQEMAYRMRSIYDQLHALQKDIPSHGMRPGTRKDRIYTAISEMLKENGAMHIDAILGAVQSQGLMRNVKDQRANLANNLSRLKAMGLLTTDFQGTWSLPEN